MLYWVIRISKDSPKKILTTYFPLLQQGLSDMILEFLLDSVEIIRNSTFYGMTSLFKTTFTIDKMQYLRLKDVVLELHFSLDIVEMQLGNRIFRGAMTMSNMSSEESLFTTVKLLQELSGVVSGSNFPPDTVEMLLGKCMLPGVIHISETSSKKSLTTTELQQFLSGVESKSNYSLDTVEMQLENCVFSGVMTEKRMLHGLISVFYSLSNKSLTTTNLQQALSGVVSESNIALDTVEMLTFKSLVYSLISVSYTSSKKSLTLAKLQQVLSGVLSESNFSPDTIGQLLEICLLLGLISNTSSKKSHIATKLQQRAQCVVSELNFSPYNMETSLQNCMLRDSISISNTSPKKSLTTTKLHQGLSGVEVESNFSANAMETLGKHDTKDYIQIFCCCDTSYKAVCDIFYIVASVFRVDDTILAFQKNTECKNTLRIFGEAMVATICSLDGNWHRLIKPYAKESMTHILHDNEELIRNFCDRITRLFSCICFATSKKQIGRMHSISQQTDFISNLFISYRDFGTDKKALANVDWYDGMWSHLFKNYTGKLILMGFDYFACDILLEEIDINLSRRANDNDSTKDKCITIFREKVSKACKIIPFLEADPIVPSHKHSLEDNEHFSSPRTFNHADAANSNVTNGDFTHNKYLPLYREKVKKSFTNANSLETNQLCRHNLADIEQFQSQAFYHKDVAKSHFPEHSHVKSMILRETLISNFETDLFDSDICVKDTKNLKYLSRFQTNALFPQILDVYPVRRNDLDFSFQQILSGVSQTSQEVMRFELQRFASFQNYDYPNSPNAFRFAKAGWYATGNGKETACFACNVRFADWVQNHNPMDVHRQLSPSCPFLIGEDVEHVDVSRPSSQCERTQSQEITDNLHEMQLGERPGTVNGRGQLVSNENPGQETTFNPARFDDTVDSQMLNTSIQGSNGPLFNGFRFGNNSSDSVPHSFREDVDQSRRQTDNTATTNFSSFVSNDCPLSSSNTHRSGDSSRTHDEADTTVRNFRQNALMGLTSTSPNPCRNGEPNIQTLQPNEYRLPSPLSSNNTPMFPAYQSLNVRISSYQGFPAHVKQTPRQLAQAGFFYRGFGDRCSCFWCGIGLQHWEAGDDPWVEHAHRSHRCQYVIDCKGESFITLVQEALVRPDPVFPQPVMNSKESLIYELREMGFLLEAIHCAIKTVESNGINLTLQTVANAILEMSNETSNSSEPDRQVPEKTTQKHQEMAINVSPKLNSNPIDQSADASSKSLSEETAAMKEQLTCKICLDANVGIVFLPCGHIVACATCSVRLSKCPICRKFIREKVKTLM